MTEQRDAAWVSEMRKQGSWGTDQIVKAQNSGELNDLLGIRTYGPKNADEQWSAPELQAAYKAGQYDQIEAARISGFLNTLLGIEDK